MSMQRAYDHFNLALFDDKLPQCLITLQREKRTLGYFSRDRFTQSDGKVVIDEIAMNPSYFAIRSIADTLSTLVHEMVHQWQRHFGDPGRRSYHNKEWATEDDNEMIWPLDHHEPVKRAVRKQAKAWITTLSKMLFLIGNVASYSLVNFNYLGTIDFYR